MITTLRLPFWFSENSEPLGPWASYTNALTFLRPRPPSIQLAPQFRIAVFRKSCPHVESDRIVPQPAAFAAGRRLAFRSCASDHVRSPPRAVAARGSDGRRSESSLHRVPLFKQTYIRSEADIRSISPSGQFSSRTVARKATTSLSLQGKNAENVACIPLRKALSEIPTTRQCRADDEHDQRHTERDRGGYSERTPRASWIADNFDRTSQPDTKSAT
jgi:hypothetical protein